jgi:HEAT repeat protein
VALRKHRDSIDEALYERALAAIAAAEMSVERSLVLRSVARDPRVGPLLVSSLGADDASVRAAAARGLELLADRRYSPAVAAALASERDSEVFRRLAAAATLLGAEVPYPALRRQLSSIETASEALVAAAGSLSRYGARRSSYLRSAFREALRAEDPRVRAGAARALLVCDDREAWRALVFTLDDAVPEVRLAAASALAHLAVAEATPAIEARWRVEEDPRVLPALLDAAAAPDRRPVRAPELGGRAGDESVRVRIVAVGEEGRSGVPVEILLPDGRWLRMRTLPSGELVVVDLPAAVVDVRVKVAE